MMKNTMNLLRRLSVQHKPRVSLDENVGENIKNEAFNLRRHPGIITPKIVKPPERLEKAINAVLEDRPIKALLAHSEILVRHLKNRVPPMENSEVKELTQHIHSEVLSKIGELANHSKEEESAIKQSVKDKVLFRLKKRIYNWKPVDYTDYNAQLYLLGRFAPEYAVLTKIFSEIKMRDEDFKPKNFFDFGSGVGTAMWAASSLWANSITEYLNVDSSSSMNDLSQILLQDGRGNKSAHLRGVFHRQFLPATNNLYDLVVSAYSFLELPSVEARLETLIKLWNKTNKYLIIVENGTNGGFRIINEARDFILHIKDENSKGHVFSPCPHDTVCPRYLNSEDNTPCNFQVKYYTLPFGKAEKVEKELYSYVVFKKGVRNSNDKQWPRVVRETLIRPRHTICRMCTHKGKLEEVIFTASKHGKIMYHCARFSKWGDLLPVQIEDTET